MDLPVPTLMVGWSEMKACSTACSVTTDAFAQGDNRLVNHKTYYFMALAYGYNNYEAIRPRARKRTGRSVQSFTKSSCWFFAIVRRRTPQTQLLRRAERFSTPHTVQRRRDDDATRARATAMTDLELTAASEEDILGQHHRFDGDLRSRPRPCGRAGGGSAAGSFNADFELRVAGDDADLEDAIDAYWTLTNLSLLSDTDPDNDYQAVYESASSIALLNEELLLNWGLSVTVHQYAYPLDGKFTEPVHSSITFDDPARPWLLGIPDAEGFNQLNWIRAGNQEGASDVPSEVIFNDLKTGNPLDEDEVYEGILGGTWAPYCLVSYTGDVELPSGEVVKLPNIAPTIDGFEGDLSPFSGISGLNNVDVVLTKDKSLWTRCPGLGDAVGRRTRSERRRETRFATPSFGR